MKKIIGFIIIVIVLPLFSVAQNVNRINKKVEFGFAIDPAQGGSGILLKAKQRLINTRHFDGYVGVAGQYHRNKEKKFSESLNGGTTDLGVYLVSDCLLYPFSSKHVFIGAEGFAGITNFRTKGTLTLPEHSIAEKYSNQYTYFNYGVNLSLGYDFGRLSTNMFINASLKGFLDKGRFRPLDTDSKGFAGLSMGFKL